MAAAAAERAAAHAAAAVAGAGAGGGGSEGDDAGMAGLLLGEGSLGEGGLQESLEAGGSDERATRRMVRRELGGRGAYAAWDTHQTGCPKRVQPLLPAALLGSAIWPGQTWRQALQHGGGSHVSKLSWRAWLGCRWQAELSRACAVRGRRSRTVRALPGPERAARSTRLL